MSSHLSIVPRHTLTTRQAEVVDRLLRAAGEELERVGHERLTVRAVAQRARVSSATAYTYVASKDHLLAELFWRRLVSAGEAELGDEPPERRLALALRHLTAVIGGAPATAAAATKSLLGSDPQVAALRPRIGALVVDHLRSALGPDADPRLLETVSYAFFGALLHCGMGLLPYDELGRRLDDVVAVLEVDR